MNIKRSYYKYYLAALVSVVTIAVYLPVLRNGFVNWTDDLYILNNRHIRALNADFLWWAFAGESIQYWQPLSWISHALDYALWGLNPAGHHLTSLLHHGLNTFLVVCLAATLLEISRRPAAGKAGNDTGRFPDQRAVLIAAGVTGILFGLHPLHVESVAWATDRKGLLYSFFSLLAIMTYVTYAISRSDQLNDPDRPGSPRVWYLDRSYLATLVLFALALASKPMAITLPLVLLILDWYPFQRVRSWKSAFSLVGEKIPFFVLSLAVSVLTLVQQTGHGAVVSLQAVPVSSRLLTAAQALLQYLGKLLLPVHLVPVYPFPRNISFFSVEYLAYLVLLAGISAACAVMIRTNRVFPAIWGSYVISVLPMLGIIKAGSVSMADRFVYLPILAPCLLIGIGAAWVWEKADAPGRRRRLYRGVIAAIALALLLAMAHLTTRQVAVWKDSITLWTYVIEKEPDRVALAYGNRGLALEQAGQLDRALADLSKAISLSPSYADFYNNRGALRGKAGESVHALEDFTQAITLNPSHAGAYSNRGLKLQEAGQFDRALDDLNKALELDPSMGDAYLNRGLTFENMNQPEQAREDYTRAIALDPSDNLAWYYRGIVLGRMGRVEEALQDYARAIMLNPGYADAYQDRGDLYRKSGRLELAAADYRKACGLGSQSGCSALQAIAQQ